MPTAEELFKAIAVGDADLVDQVLRTDPALVSTTHDGVSPLRAAVYHQHAALAPVLHAFGAESDTFDSAALGEVDKLRAILDADPTLVDSRSGDGFSALHLAAFFGHAKVAELLLGRGADPRAVAENGSGLEPINSAAAGGHPAIAHLLLDRGADVDSIEAEGFSPLHAAAAAHNIEMVSLLLGRGADPSLLTADGRTARDLTDDPAIAALLP